MTRRRLPIACLAAALLVAPAAADEGMFPVTMLSRLQLQRHGLAIPLSTVYNPGGASLVQAIVRVGGCTGSFVSHDGLVLTNHHCAFGALQAASTADHDYITDGYLAGTRDRELRADGLTAQFAEAYRDVSAEVLDGLTPLTDPAEREATIGRRRKALEDAEEAAHPGSRAEVSEMFAGRSYLLFRYAIFRDVRVVYVPPRSIGEFGGEDDNWMWPRQTGDFSFLRVYVGPDGRGTEYAEGHVPYHPRVVLQVNPAGVAAGDFVFLLGYPGRTYRHRNSDYLAFEAEVRMPYVADVLEREIDIMRRAGQTDRAVALKFDARVKGLSNVMKNYRGKIAGVRRTGLIAARRADEAALARFIDADPARRARWGHVLGDIAGVYAEMRQTAPRDLLLELLWGPHTSASTVLGAALALEAHAREAGRPDADRDPRFTDRNAPRVRDGLVHGLSDYDAAADRALLEERLDAALALPSPLALDGLRDWLDGRPVGSALDAAYAAPRLADPGAVAALWDDGPGLAHSTDPMVDLARRLYPAFDEARRARERRDGALNGLWAEFVAAKAEMQQADFVPDGNRTLRLTYGHVKGYVPHDGLRATPFTTVQGVVDKTTGVAPYYDTPRALLDRVAARDYGAFAAAPLGTVPVDLLYDADTTGGNSGSPVLDARGRVVGVNFDRVWEATINDYAWSAEYSRSIGVDIRYVLWVASKIGGATAVIDEMLGREGRTWRDD
jgi:hypothetical protein